MDDAWERYYQEAVMPFSEQAFAYERGLKYLTEKKGLTLLNPENPLTFVLGGFHPGSTSATDFQEFCCKIHPNPHDKHVYLDMNHRPFKFLSEGRRGVRAPLESLPFSHGSVDVIFLDFTQEFMNDRQLAEFSASANQVLTDNGLVVLSADCPLFVFQRRLAERTKWGKMGTHPKKMEKILKLTSSLKPVYRALASKKDSSCFDLLILARKESPLPQFLGDPFALNEDDN